MQRPAKGLAIGSVAIVLAIVALAPFGLALYNLQQAGTIAADAALPVFVRRVAYLANMHRVLVFGLGSSAVAVAATIAGVVARRTRPGQFGLAIGSLVFVGGLFLQVMRAQSSFSPTPEREQASASDLERVPSRADEPPSFAVPPTVTIDSEALKALGDTTAKPTAAVSPKRQPAKGQSSTVGVKAPSGVRSCTTKGSGKTAKRVCVTRGPDGSMVTEESSVR
ncbi:MAG: hypothetical protein HOW73_27450 [Polyangiaceae bacterium]|nr:hypothetical protein [Polyangiaceae bacterium]